MIQNALLLQTGELRREIKKTPKQETKLLIKPNMTGWAGEDTTRQKCPSDENCTVQ